MGSIFVIFILIVGVITGIAVGYVFLNDSSGEKFCQKLGYDEVFSSVFSNKENRIVCVAYIEPRNFTEEFHVEETFGGLGWHIKEQVN